MAGRSLAQGLMAANGEQLRLIYVIMMKTNIFQMLANKTKDLFDKDVDHSQEKLMDEIKKLKYVNDYKLRLELFLYMTKELKLPGSIYNTTYEIENKCSEIVQKAYTSQLDDDKEFKAFVERNEHLPIDSQLALFQMQKVFKSLGDELDNLSVEQQEQFADQIENFIQSLPAEQQRQIKEKLNIDSITNSTLKKVIATQGSAVLLAVIVEIVGFAAYTTLTTVIYNLAGLIGLTLPFSAYMTATSLFSILTGPIGLLLISGANGAIMFAQNKKVKRTLLQMGIAQLMLPILLDDTNVHEYDSFINEWSKYYNKQNLLLESISEYKKESQFVSDMIDETKLEIRAHNNQLYDLNIQYYKKMNQLANSLSLVEEHEMTDLFKKNSIKIERLYLEIRDKKDTVYRNKYGPKKSILDKVSGVFSNFSLENEINKLNKQIEELKRQQANEILIIRPAALQKECDEVRAILNNKNEVNKKLSSLNNELKQLKSKLTTIKGKLHQKEKELQQLQKEIYGLGDIV